MEYNGINKAKDIAEEREMLKQLDIFIKLIKKLEKKNMKIFVYEDKKLLLKEYVYINQLLNIYLKEKKILKSKTGKEIKYFIINIIKRTRPFYTIKTYKNFEGIEHMRKYNKYLSKKKNSINNFFIIVCFCLFLKVISSKKDKNIIILIYKLMKQLFSFVGKLFLEEIIDINYFELMMKLLLTFSIKNSLVSLEEDINQRNEIHNLIFLKCSIMIIKDIFEKLLLSQKKFTKSQSNLINDIIIFIQNNIITYSDINKRKIIYNNIHFLSKNDYYTTQLFDLYQIVLNTNTDSIIKNYLELLSNIYAFSFEYKNIMRPLLKRMEPLFVDLKKKSLERINSELHSSNFSLSLINSLINKEKEMTSEEVCKLNEGFYLNNSKSGLIGNMKSLENDFTIIFAIKLDKENEDEITVFKLFSNFEKNYYISFFLRKKFNHNSYDLICEQNLDKLKNNDIKINVEKEMNYIFAITFKSEGIFKSTIKTRYIKDSAKDFFSGSDVKTKSIKKDNLKIAFGCDLNPKSNTIEGKFKGFIGDIIIFNSKNYKIVDGNKNFEGDFIINLKGEYKNIIDLLIEKENQENNIFINKKQNEETKEKLKNMEIEKNMSLDNIKLIISPDYFKLINYYDDIDYLNIPNNILDNKASDKYFIKRKYADLKLKSEPNDNDENIIIHTLFFDNNFHPYKNYLTLNEFIKYDGINFLSLLMEYYYQILNNIYEKKMMKETEDIKEICKKVENKILENLKFMNENILKNNNNLNISFDEVSKYFYQLSITILKFIEIEEINFDVIKYILEIIGTINNNEKQDTINQLKLNLIIFLLNPNLFKREEVNVEKLLSTLEGLLKIIKENIKNENFRKKMICEDYFNQLFLLLWIFDNFNTRENNNYDKSEVIVNNTRKIFKELLDESLKILIIKKEEEELQLTEVTQAKKSKKNIMINEEKEREKKEREKEKIKKNEIINLIFEKLGDYRDNTNIFCIVLDIVRNLNLTQNTDMSRIIKIIKKIVEYKNREEKNTKNKILNTCIVYLFQIYLVDKEDENINEKYFHSFIRKLGLNLDVIYSLIAAMNLLKIGNKNKGGKTQMKTDKFDEVLLKLNLNELTDENFKEIYIIKSIFEDIVYILNICGESSSKDLLDVLEKNVDEIFNPVKETKNLFFKEFFSSDSKICAEFYYFKWRATQNKTSFLDDFLKKYNILLSIYPNPFFFKFYYLIFKEVEDGVNEENNDKNRLHLLSGILEYLNTFYNNNKNENNISLINNLYNFIILLNFEYEKKNSLIFKNSTFQNIFFTAVSLLDKTGVLYSNFYIELGDLKGKLVSEIIYDIYFNITDYSFEANKFINIFIKKNEKTKEIYTIFYFMDICKEIFFEKDKKTKEEIKVFIPHYEKILFIRNYLKKNKVKLFQGKNLYKIEHINLSIYFIAKSFIYYKKRELNKNFKELLMGTFLPLLSDDIYNLYTQKSRFYGNELCKSFPLYYFVKSFIESNIIPDKNFQKYFNYINNEMPMELKDENNLESCYSSRLAKNKGTKKKNSFDENEFEIEQTNEQLDNNNSNFKKGDSLFPENNNTILNGVYNNNNNIKNIGVYGTEIDTINNDSKLSNDKSNDDSSLNFNLASEKPVLNIFSNFKNTRNIIFSGKKYFLRNIFSECFNDLLYNDNNFKKIKLTFLLKYREYRNIDIDTKQLNYPITQKNFSNSFEPKIFLKRDSTFYNKFYLEISHNYFNKDICFKKLETIDFYPHIFKFDDRNDKNKSLFCELVTLNYIAFGKFYFFDDYIIFKSEEDPRDNQAMDIDLFIKYGISMKAKDIPSKRKFIILYSDSISEVIQRRTLLVNNSLEIFMKNGISYFFNFFRKKYVEKAYQYFKKMNKYLEERNCKKFNFCTNFNAEDIKTLANSFKRGKITNSEYLMKLNKYSTRTYNDSSQYPIFPWILKKYDKMQEVIKIIFNREGINQKDFLSYFRDMNYPLKLQTEQDREEATKNFRGEMEEGSQAEEEGEEEKFINHLNIHYSTSAYIYYYLMRLNPFIRLMIKLQGNKLENPDRTFNNFKETENIIEVQDDNRELIPDFFCYFDFLLNLNCNFFGIYNKEFLVDDFNLMVKKNSSIYINRISSLVTSLINYNRIINNAFVSKMLNNWVDIIFGFRQLPKNKKDLLECCNIFVKTSYEQKTDIEKELKPFEDKIQLNQKNVKEEAALMKKINPIIIGIINMGVCPKQILDENISYDAKIKSYESFFKNYKFQEDKLFYFNYINDDNFIIFKDIKKNKLKTRVAIITDTNKILKDKENITYNFKSMNLMKEKNGLKNIQLYQYKYAFTNLYLLFNKSTILVVLSCRYFGNFFRFQCQEKIINIFCEDFVTSIKERNIYENDFIFYTGLINGKLIEWKIIPHLDNDIKNKKKSIKCMYNFEIKEGKHVYAHKSSISVIEIYKKQKIIITSGEDKFIYIRKAIDFELLTVINLIYAFGNPVISQHLNIFPSLIKVSDLNLLYVLIYDYDKQRTFIRGYNLNGLFFAQTDQEDFKNDNENLLFNYFSFTKYSNLIAGFYNSNNIFVLNGGTLSPIWYSELEEKEEGKKEKKEKVKDIKKEIGSKIIEFNPNNGDFYVLKESEVIISSIKEKSKLKELESL